MPAYKPARKVTLRFEEIPPSHRPAAVDCYMRLLDEGYLPENITFARYDDVLRIESTSADGSTGTSRPAEPRSPLPDKTHAATPLERGQRQALIQERKAQLAGLEGARVRAVWPGGHERIGVIERRDRFNFDLVPTDRILLHLDDEQPLIEPFTSRWAQPAPSAAAATNGAA
jgi:hypothetical protein